MKWRDIPVGARRYIIYHTIISPLLSIWYLLPMYMFITGYNVLEIGLLFTAIHIISIPLTYAIGKAFEYIDIKKGLMLIDVLDGVSSFLYGLAYGLFAPLMITLGLIVDRVSRLFYPLYQAAEKLLYPKEKLEEVFSWHMRLPEVSQLISFPIIGYIFGYMYSNPIHYRIGFLAIALSSIPTTLYIYKFIPSLGRGQRIEPEKFRFRVDREFKLILVIEALTTLAWSMAPIIVLLNYIVNTLGLTIFEALLVEASLSLGAISATYISDRIGKEHRFHVISAGYLMITLWAMIMFLNPPFLLVLLSYFVSRFGDTLMFPFYRAWIFEKVPKDRASTIFSALSSYNRIISMATPAIAGLLALIYPTLPYLLSLILFLLSALILFIYGLGGAG